MIILGFGLMFWAALSILILASVFLVEQGMFGWNAVGMIASVIAMSTYFNLGLGSLVIANPVLTVTAVVLYLIIGAVYSTQWKFRRLCKSNAEESKLKRERYAGTDEEFNRDTRAFKMHPANHYDRIIGWALFWPESMLWIILKAPIQWINALGAWIYRVSAKTLMRIAISSSMSK